jgi:hypothetical protein
MSGCYYDKEDKLYPNTSQAIDTSNVTYSNSVKPIISTSCTTTPGCHTSSNPSGGYKFDNYTDLNTYLNNTSNLFLCAIKHTCSSTSKYMPQGGVQLSAAQIATIETWINKGHLNN